MDLKLPVQNANKFALLTRLLYVLLTGIVSVIVVFNNVFTTGDNTVLSIIRWLWIILLVFSPIVLIFANEITLLIVSVYTIFKTSSKSFKFSIGLSLIVMTIFLFISTGTLSPYANLLDQNYIIHDSCNNLYNGDYGQFTALYYLIDNKEKDSWEYSVVLRRILYNLLSYPFMKCIGHDPGGILFNIILAWISIPLFSLFVYRTIGDKGAHCALWLCTVFPGTAYFVGQPFLYGLIVPASLFIYILLWGIITQNNVKLRILYSLTIGILCTGYDFLPFVIPAFIMISFISKQLIESIIYIVLMIAPLVIWWFILKYILGGSFSSENSLVYGTIIKSWTSGFDIKEWMLLLSQIPLNFMQVFFSSSFIFLPAAAVLTLFILNKNILLFSSHHILACSALFLSFIIVFLINNAAPPYQGAWQMRGNWIARIYEPVFIVMIIFISTSAQQIYSVNIPVKRAFLSSILALCCIGNSFVMAGPILNDPFRFSSTVYWQFYRHYKSENMKKNLSSFGRKPFALCNNLWTR